MARPRIGPSPRKPRRAAPTRTCVLGACRTPKADEGIGPGLGPHVFIIKRELDTTPPLLRRLAASPYFFQPRSMNQAKRLQRGPSESPKDEGPRRDERRKAARANCDVFAFRHAALAAPRAPKARGRPARFVCTPGARAGNRWLTLFTIYLLPDPLLTVTVTNTKDLCPRPRRSGRKWYLCERVTSAIPCT